MTRYTVVFIMAVLVLAGCAGSEPPPPPPDPLALVTEAGENIRTKDTFRMEVLSAGADYYVETDFGANVTFRQVKAQYVAPATLQGSVRLIVAGIPTDVAIFSRGDEQWFRNTILTGGQWVQQPFAPGFNPGVLIAEDTGFQAALASIIDLDYAGEETLEGVPVYRVTGLADGRDISGLLAGIVQIEGNAEVDVYIHREERVPVRFVIVLPDTATERTPQPTTWTVDVYDINAEPDLDVPGE